MKVLFVGNTGVRFRESGKVSQSTKVRVENIIGELRRLHRYDFKVLFLGDKSTARACQMVDASDVVVFHRIQGGRFLLPLKWSLVYSYAVRTKPVIFDYDDAIYLEYPFLADFATALATRVTVSSHELYVHAARLNKNTYLVPSAVDTSIFRPLDKNANLFFKTNEDTIVVGWHGSTLAHMQNLTILRAALEGMAPDFRRHLVLRLIGGPFTNQLGRHFEKLVKLELGPPTWIPYELLPRYLAGVDIGVYPLQDGRYSRGKASMKMIEYMAMGIPVVASSIGENMHIISDGCNGFLADNSEEWTRDLQHLMLDSTLRSRLGNEAHETALRNYSLENVAERFSNILREMLRNHP